MEIRSLARKNTITSLNRKATIIIPKLQKGQFNEQQTKESTSEKIICDWSSHHAYRYIRGTIHEIQDYRKFVTLLYRSLFYSVNNLKGPSQDYLKKKKVRLPQPESKALKNLDENRKKFLILDLDETLIHSIFTEQKSDVRFQHNGDQFKFNVRPHCFEFLEEMSKHYLIYVFTAGTKDYAQPIVAYLNKPKKTILSVLHRKNCMETNNGFFIKDLRIIQNRDLKDIIIIDNLVHSFGLQLQNGLPILEFTNNKKDVELKGIKETLINLASVPDVRQVLKQSLELKKILNINQNCFLAVESSKNKC